MIGLSARAVKALETTQSSSFSMDLKKWRQIMQSYETGSHAYHATMPTMALIDLRDTMRETRERGFATVRAQQFELGRQVRALLAGRGFPSVAAQGFEAPGVVVSYTTDPEVQNAKKFAAQGVQAAAGVPLMCDEPKDFATFRLGLFGLDKWAHVERSVSQLAAALDRMGYPARANAPA
jgi:aspartate aminotransferase-like enzyme